MSTEHPITGTIQPLPQFDECAKVIVAPAITTARDKKVPIKIANTTDFPYTKATDTKIAELQILKPEETKMIRPVDIGALNFLTEHHDVVTYINALMQVERPEDNEEKFWFPTPKFNVSLTPKDDKPVYTQNLPVPINLKEDLTVELALMHRYGIITTLPFSKYASPILAQRKPTAS